MKTLYLECKTGASGDMIAGALMDLVADKAATTVILRGMLPQGTEIAVTEEKRREIKGTRLSVTQNTRNVHQHTLADIYNTIRVLNTKEKVKSQACRVYEALAEAESAVHGASKDEVHFHEVGSPVAVAGVVLTCGLLDMLGIGRIVCSPVNVGGGVVRCAHGILPVPAPATANLLKGVPVYQDGETELCTTTGAALVATLADGFGAMPAMRLTSVGYGLGGRELPDRANCVRAILGESEEGDCDCVAEEVTKIVCNVDDMTGEAVGFATEKLMREGALDVTTVCGMTKKNRPCFVITCICRTEESEKFVALMLKHTSTLGVRVSSVRRLCLNRETVTENTPLGEVRFKRSCGAGVRKSKPEYDDVARIADDKGMSFSEALAAVVSDGTDGDKK